MQRYIFLLIFSIQIISCRKENISDNYRDKFTGKYYCHFITTYWNIGVQGVDTLEDFYDTIDVTKNKFLLHQIKISDKSYDIDKNGYHYYTESDFETFTSYTEEFTFRNDSIFLTFYFGEKHAGTSHFKWGIKII